MSRAMKRLLSERTVFTVGNVAHATLHVGAAIVTARLLGPSARGEMVLVITISGLVTLLATAGTSTAFRSLFPGSTLRLRQSYTALTLGLAVLAALATAAATALFEAGGPALLLVSAGMHAGVTAVHRQCLDAWMASGDLLRGVGLACWGASLGLLACVVVVPLTQSASVAVACLAFGPAAASMWTVPRLLRRGVLGSPFPHVREAQALVRAGVLSLGYTLGTGVAFRVDRLLLGLVVSPSALGVYSAGQALSEGGRVFANAAAQVGLRDVAVRGATPRAAWRAAGPVVALAVAVLILLAAVPEVLVTLAFGPDYHQAADLLPALVLAELALLPYQIEGRILIALRRPGAAGLCGALGGLVVCVVGIILIPTVGVWGAVIASACGYASMSVASVVLRRRISARPSGPAGPSGSTETIPLPGAAGTTES